LGGYGPAIRSFFFRVQDLHLQRKWSQDLFGTDGPRFESSISGKAVSEDRVGVIGRDGTVKEFDFTLGVDTHVKTTWERFKEVDAFPTRDHSKYHEKHVRIKNLISERFEENPPTAFLCTYDDNWEIGIKAGWSIDCNVPPDVLARLEDEIESGTVSSILISVHWQVGLVRDQHAPLSFPTIWGLFCLEENGSPEPLYGHVNSISWAHKIQGKTNREETGYEMPAPTAAPAKTVAPVAFNVPKYAIVALWVLALAAVAHLFK
jgi:hypothetical protein